jgi:hypothetical protein
MHFGLLCVHPEIFVSLCIFHIMFTGMWKDGIFYSRKLDCVIYGVKSVNIETR